MIEKFWEALAGKLADRWATVALPALGFWSLVLSGWAWHRGGLHVIRSELRSLDRYSSIGQALIVAVGLGVVVTSTALVDQLTRAIIPLLGGRWPSWARPLADRRTATFRRRQEDLEVEWAMLTDRVLTVTDPEPADEIRLVSIDEELRRFPVPASRMMPTRFGNILRAAETRPQARSGLVTSVVVPRLLLVIPDPARRDLARAWAAATVPASILVWSVLLLPVAAWCPWLLVTAAVGVLICWWWLPQPAETYADLLESTLDMYRVQLYQTLRWPLPLAPHSEQTDGMALSQYLLRGTVDPSITYRGTPPGGSA